MRIRNSVIVSAISVILCTAFLFSGCTSAATKKIEGDYKAEYDSTYILESIFEQQAYDVKAEGVIITPYSLSLKDGKFTLEMDVEGYKKSFIEYLDKNIDAITTAMIVSYGYGDDEESKEEFLTYTTFNTFEEFTEYIRQDFIATMGFDSMTSQTKTGKYSVSGKNIKFKQSDYEFTGTVNDDGTLTVEGADVSPLEFSLAK